MGGIAYVPKHELADMQAELARLRAALEPFAALNATRFMTDGIRYDFRVDVAWIREARAVLTKARGAEPRS